MPKINISMTVDQADAVSKGLDAFSRLCIGQLEEVSHLVRYGVIPMASLNGGERVQASAEVCDQVEALMNEVKKVLGYPRNGSHGIGHSHVSTSGHRAYEVKKVLDRAVAVQRDPNPKMRGVNYDGLTVRYTQDPEPIVTISE